MSVTKWIKEDGKRRVVTIQKACDEHGEGVMIEWEGDQPWCPLCGVEDFVEKYWELKGEEARSMISEYIDKERYVECPNYEWPSWARRKNNKRYWEICGIMQEAIGEIPNPHR